MWLRRPQVVISSPRPRVSPSYLMQQARLCCSPRSPTPNPLPRLQAPAFPLLLCLLRSVRRPAPRAGEPIELGPIRIHCSTKISTLTLPLPLNPTPTKLGDNPSRPSDSTSLVVVDRFLIFILFIFLSFDTISVPGISL